MHEKPQDLTSNATDCHCASGFHKDQHKDIEDLIGIVLSFLKSKVDAAVFVLVPDNKLCRAYLVRKNFEPGQFNAIALSPEKNAHLFNILSENSGKTDSEKAGFMLDLFGESGHHPLVAWHMSPVGDYIAAAALGGKETSPVWDPADQLLLDALGKSLSLDRELNKALNEKRLLSHALENLSEVNRIILENGSFESALECVLNGVYSIVGAEGAGFLLYDEETKSLTLQKPAFRSYDDQLIDLYKVTMEDGGNAVKVFQSEEPYLSNNVPDDPRIIQGLAKLFNVRNIVSTPVKVTNKCIGVFHVINKPGGFSGEDLGIIRLFVSQLAIAIENARLMCHIRAQESQARSLYELSMEFKLSKAERLVKLAAKKICSTIPVTMLAIAISDGKGKGRIVADAGLCSGMVGRAVQLLPARTGAKDLTEDCLEDLEAEAARRGMCTQMAFLIQSESGVFGKLWIWSDKRNAFSPQLTRFLSLVVNQLTIALENAYLFEREKKMAQRLQRFIDLNERLLRLVLKSAGIQAITNTIARYLTAGVIFYDHRLVKRAWAPQDNNELKDFDPALLLDAEGRAFQPGSGAWHPAPLRYKGNLTRDVVAAPIDVGGDTLGYLFVVMEPARHDEDFLSVIQRTLPVYALELLKEQVAREVMQNVEGDFVSALLEGRYIEEQIFRQASGLGYDLSIPRVVVVAELHSDAPQGPNKLISFWRPSLYEINLYLKRNFPQSLAVALQGQLIILLPCNHLKKSGELDGLRNIVQKIWRQLERITGGKVSIGIGRIAQGIKDLESSHKDASFSIKYLKQTKQKEQVVAFRDLGLYQALADESAAGHLYNLMRELLGPLLDSDKNKGTTYLKTLDHYFIAGCSIKTAAERLFCHVNTVRYRLDRAKKLSRMDIDDVERRFDIQMSLKIAKFYYPEFFVLSNINE